MFRPIRPDEDAVVSRELLSMSLGYPSPEQVERARARYDPEAGWHLLGYAPAGPLLGSIGIQITGPGEGTVRHIAVLPAYRSQGIGRRLLQHAVEADRLHRLVAETDQDAVGFYRRCGFIITSLGERYPGVERFKCELGRAPHESPDGGDSLART